MFPVCLFLSNFATHNDDKKRDKDHQSFYLIRYMTVGQLTPVTTTKLGYIDVTIQMQTKN